MRRALAGMLAIAALAATAAAAEVAPSYGLSDSVEELLAARTGLPPSAMFLPPADSEVLGMDFRVTAWLIAPEANIEAELEGSSGHAETDLGDTFVSGIRLEVVGKRLGLMAELEADGLDSDDTPSDYSYTDARADLGIIFRAIGGGERGTLKLDIFGGARYHMTDQDAGVSDGDEWWEPFAGAEVRIPFLIGNLNGRLTLSGFDMGPMTLQWTASAAWEIPIGPVFGQIGIRYQDTHFTSNSEGGYSLDAQSFGPFIALGVDF